ncbi:hypothetical protein FACS1894202_00390 [Clostridia bacterium]|nr:hypothetical protein FACS1894202_00390 [Clostridia bacterium]
MYCVGSIVKAEAGREKGEVMAVIAVDGEYLLLADGRRRKHDKPKRKKARHVSLISEKEELPLPLRDIQIRHLLSRFTEKEESEFVKRGSH